MIQNYVTGYLAGAVLMQVISALKTPYEEVRPVTVLCLLWPVTLIFIIAVLLGDLCGWTVDIAKGNSRFGLRKPSNPDVKGFAIVMFGWELQVFKTRKI